MHGDEIHMRDQRLVAAEAELHGARTERAIAQDEAARERARANDLDMQLSAANFRAQDLA